MIFGAIDFSVTVAKLASELGYRVAICDARPPFAERPRFSEVAEVVVDPDRHLEGRSLGPRDVVLVFTHDPKFGEPALIAATAGRGTSARLAAAAPSASAPSGCVRPG